MLREVTDTQGIDWYVCATHATKIGNYYSADGSMATELWLKKSDCTELSSLTIRTTDQTRIGIVRTAIENLGDDYTYGMTGPDEFDCSGFVNYVMAQNGISVPRQSSAICQMSGQISIEDLRPGDIVGRPGHVGVYIGRRHIRSFLRDQHRCHSGICGYVQHLQRIYQLYKCGRRLSCRLARSFIWGRQTVSQS